MKSGHFVVYDLIASKDRIPSRVRVVEHRYVEPSAGLYRLPCEARRAVPFCHHPEREPREDEPDDHESALRCALP